MPGTDGAIYRVGGSNMNLESIKFISFAQLAPSDALAFSEAVADLEALRKVWCVRRIIRIRSRRNRVNPARFMPDGV